MATDVRSPLALPVRNSLERMIAYGESLLADFPHDRYLWRPAPDMNHAAWLISHLAIYPDVVLGFIERPDLVETREGANEKYGHGSTCTDDPADYLAPDELAEWFLTRHRVLASAIDDVDPALLERPFPDEARRDFWPTIGAAVVFMACTHLPMHLGQVSMLRRLSGRDRLF